MQRSHLPDDAPQHDAEFFSPAGLKNLEEIGSQLVLALESSYNALRRQFPQIEVKRGVYGHIPEAVIVISSSSSKYGHFAKSRWTIQQTKLPEIMMSAEGLRREPRDVLGTLVHEAAHGIAATAGVDDVDKRGRYHNEIFAHVASELGLHVTQSSNRWVGHSNTTIPEGEYAELIEDLAPKLIAWREIDAVQQKPPRKSRERILNCSCEKDLGGKRVAARTIRAFPSTIDLGPILCGVCGGEFE